MFVKQTLETSYKISNCSFNDVREWLRPPSSNHACLPSCARRAESFVFDKSNAGACSASFCHVFDASYGGEVWFSGGRFSVLLPMLRVPVFEREIPPPSCLDVRFVWGCSNLLLRLHAACPNSPPTARLF